MESFWLSRDILLWNLFDFKSVISTRGDYCANIHKQYGVYFESQRSRIISNLIHFYALLRFEPSDPASEDIPMCHRVTLPNSKVCSYNKPQRKSELLYKKVYYFFDKVPFDLKVYKKYNNEILCKPNFYEL